MIKDLETETFKKYRDLIREGKLYPPWTYVHHFENKVDREWREPEFSPNSIGYTLYKKENKVFVNWYFGDTSRGRVEFRWWDGLYFLKERYLHALLILKIISKKEYYDLWHYDP